MNKNNLKIKKNHLTSQTNIFGLIRTEPSCQQIGYRQTNILIKKGLNLTTMELICRGWKKMIHNNPYKIVLEEVNLKLRSQFKTYQDRRNTPQIRKSKIHNKESIICILKIRYHQIRPCHPKSKVKIDLLSPAIQST